jgi:hypothetical protein
MFLIFVEVLAMSGRGKVQFRRAICGFLVDNLLFFNLIKGWDF